jgi:hypothetical protein
MRRVIDRRSQKSPNLDGRRNRVGSGRRTNVATILAPLIEQAVERSRGDFVATVKSVTRSQVGSGEPSRELVTRTLGLNVRTFDHPARGGLHLF